MLDAAETAPDVGRGKNEFGAATRGALHQLQRSFECFGPIIPGGQNVAMQIIGRGDLRARTVLGAGGSRIHRTSSPPILIFAPRGQPVSIERRTDLRAQIGHLQRAVHRFGAFISGFAARALEGLFESVGGQNPENNRDSGVQATLAMPDAACEQT